MSTKSKRKSEEINDKIHPIKTKRRVSLKYKNSPSVNSINDLIIQNLIEIKKPMIYYHGLILILEKSINAPNMIFLFYP